jgi:transcriptional regulator with XRE-family HTH domain
MSQNGAYNAGHLTPRWSERQMPKKRTYELEGFGVRLAELRKRAGYTQVELAEELGTSQRMIAYYESRSIAPTALLPAIARALKITVDELLGTTPIKRKKEPKPRNTRLHRRIAQIEQLGAKEKRQVLQFIDTMIEREQLKKKAASG